MSKNLSQKKDVCEKLNEILKNNEVCLFVKYETITGHEFSDFRKIMKEAGADIYCVKKSLLNRVLKDDLKNLSKQEGSLMIVTSNKSLETMNALNKNIKKFQGFEIKESIFDNNHLNLKKFNVLNKFKNLDDLKSEFLTYLKFNQLKLLDVLEQIQEKK